MHPTAKSALRAAAIVAIGSGLIALYFADNIRGYYRFKELCRTEAGLRVFHPLRSGVGWTARRNEGGMAVSSFKDVAFIRISDPDGKNYDYRYESGRIDDERSYKKSPSNEAIPVTYEIRWVGEYIPEEIRLARAGFEIYEYGTNKFMARWYEIGFHTFDQRKTIFGAPSVQSCYAWNSFFIPSIATSIFIK